MSEIRRPIADGRCLIIVGGWVRIGVDVEGFIVGLSVGVVGSVLGV